MTQLYCSIDVTQRRHTFLLSNIHQLSAPLYERLQFVWEGMWPFKRRSTCVPSVCYHTKALSGTSWFTLHYLQSIEPCLLVYMCNCMLILSKEHTITFTCEQNVDKSAFSIALILWELCCTLLKNRLYDATVHIWMSHWHLSVLRLQNTAFTVLIQD